MALLLLFGGLGLLAGISLGMLVQIISLLLPFYYANLLTTILILVGVVAGVVIAVIRRCNTVQAALYADSFGGKERLSTALENADNKSEIALLQREDAIEYLELHKKDIKVVVFPGWKKAAALVLATVLLVVTILIPSNVRDIAKERHSIKKEAKEAIAEIEENVDALEQLQQEVLSEEQLQQLQEMMDMLQASQMEYRQANTQQNLQTAAQKLDFKYATMSMDLAAMASELQKQQESANSAEEKEKLEKSVEQIQEVQQQVNNSSGNATASAGQTGQQGNSGNNGGQDSNDPNGENKNGNGNGDDGQNGSGQGDGNGSGQAGGGNSKGSGSGRGEGSSDSTHDYISIPNKVGNDDALTGTHNGNDVDSYYRAQNGLAWEGEHVSYEKVIGEYADRAYEGISTGKYPSGMENVIRDYFSSFNE